MFIVMLAIFHEQDPTDNPRADVNGDGVINLVDAEIIGEHLGEQTVPAAPNPLVLPTGVTHDIVAQTLDILLSMDNGTPIFKRSIARLQKILASFIPEKTALLPNYPNPFNPETWIPYQLSEPATVTLTIYSAKGTVIRTLQIGNMSAGIYQTKSRAAYWDGKNKLGEPVASGVYFYTLTADDFTATHKMLLIK